MRASNELRKKGIFVFPSGLRSIWLRHGLESMKLRLVALEKKSVEEGIILTEAQIQALERKKSDDEACGEIETHHPGYLGSQDTFYVGTIKGVGRIFYTTKTPITAADLLNDRVLPFFVEHDMGVIRILIDRGTGYCGKVEIHDYELYLGLNDIEHTKAKARHPQTNGICERFHKTILQEFCGQIFAESSIPLWKSCKAILTSSFGITIMKERIRVKYAAAGHPCRPFWMENNYGRKKSDN